MCDEDINYWLYYSKTMELMNMAYPRVTATTGNDFNKEIAAGYTVNYKCTQSISP